MTVTTPPGWLRGAVDRRGWLELAGVFLLLTVLFALLSIDLVASILEDPTPSTGALVTGGLLGAGIALVLTALLLLTWRQGPGRVGQRLGRHAWREGCLPADEPARRLAVADLHPREHRGTSGPAPLILAGFAAFIAVLQIIGSDSGLHTAGWLLALALLSAVTIRALLDRRRLPQLRALLEQQDEPHDDR